MSRVDEVLSPFHREHDVKVTLGISVGDAPKMPLLKELGNIILVDWFYKDVAPDGAGEIQG